MCVCVCVCERERERVCVCVCVCPYWCHMKLLPSRRVLCTPYNHATCHFMQSHIPKVHACLSVTCHLHFWQNDQDLLRATAGNTGLERIPK